MFWNLVEASSVDSLQLVCRGGTVCVSGSLSGWVIPNLEPTAMIPSGTTLTVYRSDTNHVFGPDDITAAHRYMDNDQAAGKLVPVS